MLPIILSIHDNQDRAYVAEIYEKNKKKLYMIAYSILKNHQDAEDCVHDVIIILIDNLKKFKEYDNIHQINFLSKCCKNIAINKYNAISRKQKNEISIDGNQLDLVDESIDLDENINLEEYQKDITLFIKEMEPIYQDVLFYKIFLSMDVPNIAKILQVSENVVRVRLSRARKKLCEYIKRRCQK